MQNITTIGAELWIYDNEALENIESLENIDPGSIIDLHIYNNPLLAECDIDNICEYLVDPGGTVEIYNNASGCNMPEEILDSCFVIPEVNELIQEGSFTIYPNPVDEVLVVRYDLPQNSLVSITIRDLSGRLISTLVNEGQQPGAQMLFYETAALKPGVYFCTLKTAEGVQTKKIIKL
mgnify:CR=1 FL=1